VHRSFFLKSFTLTFMARERLSLEVRYVSEEIRMKIVSVRY